MTDFDKRKAATLASLSSSDADKSPKGSLDAPIIPLLDAINAHPSYFTTSSCSGRISILSQPKPHCPSAVIPTKKKARGGSWIFITHHLADPDSVLSVLFPNSSLPGEANQLGELVFRFEPLIVAVECKDLKSAQHLVSLAIACGFRESGITNAGKRVIVGIRCSIRMEVPLGDTDQVLVSKDYVRFLVEVSNEKMKANWRRTEGFLQAFIAHGAVDGSPDEVETSFVSNGGACDDNGDGDDDWKGTNRNSDDGLAGSTNCSLSLTSMRIVGEPVEKLFLWGHSACGLGEGDGNKILVFGGFGGIGRHARRNDLLLLDLLDGTLKEINAVGGPSPRMGHSSSMVGDCMFVIGGRADPSNILSEFWVLNTVKKEWKLLECTGSVLSPRHRHAAAVVGSNIYVFGGLNNDIICSSLHVLYTDNLRWEEIIVSGEQPSARHSHSMVAYGSKIFMFGGHNGEKGLGDLYSFDVRKRFWKKEKVAGRCPYARFSHSMFTYRNFIGVIGGCPVRQHYQELSLLDLKHFVWKHVQIQSVGKELFVRCTGNVVGDHLVVIGGGAACYAFGTKFSEPTKISLLPLSSLNHNLIPLNVHGWSSKEVKDQASDVGNLWSHELQSSVANHQMAASHWVVQLERKHGKRVKDLLKKHGWIDTSRKVYTVDNRQSICFPVTEQFSALFGEKEHYKCHAFESFNDSEQVEADITLSSDLSSSKALDILKQCGATKMPDEVVEVRKASKSPLQTMSEAVATLLEVKGLPMTLLEQLPSRWERLGDIVLLPVASFRDPLWDSIGEELWPLVAKSLNTCRLARQGRVASTGTRDSNLEILVGDNGWVNHRENGILFSFNATKCMFSWGNLSEKIRMGQLNCRDELVVDLFAGIGYFVLPFLVRAQAKLVYACEWNPHAIEALKQNLEVNSVSARCIVLEGDNRLVAPKGVADRVCLGLLPSSECSWITAVRALRTEGGMLHVHGNVKDTEEVLWSGHVSKSISEIAESEGRTWEVTINHLERVKWYAPHICHVVADVQCRRIIG